MDAPSCQLTEPALRLHTPEEKADIERFARIYFLCEERSQAMARVREIDEYINELMGYPPHADLGGKVRALKARESLQRLANLLSVASACTANGARGEQS
jgi:hypothetical protein